MCCTPATSWLCGFGESYKPLRVVPPANRCIQPSVVVIAQPMTLLNAFGTGVEQHFWHSSDHATKTQNIAITFESGAVYETGEIAILFR